MNLSYLLSIALCWLSPLYIYGQQEEKRAEEAEIYLQVLRPTGLEKYASGREILWKQLQEAVILNGMHAHTSPFVLETQLQLLSCETSSTAPIQFIAEVEITCYIIDRTQSRKLQQISFRPKGIATSQEKAVLAALKQIKARHPQLKKLIAGGKAQIVSTQQAQREAEEESSGEPLLIIP